MTSFNASGTVGRNGRFDFCETWPKPDHVATFRIGEFSVRVVSDGDLTLDRKGAILVRKVLP